jgi:hypothetical protein
MQSVAELDRGVEQIKDLLYRLRPGDTIVVTSNKDWHDGREMTVEAMMREKPPTYDKKYFRVRARGPRQAKNDESGYYVLMPEKPTGKSEKGHHPAPEVYHHSPDPEADHIETTKGAILQITLTV